PMLVVAARIGVRRDCRTHERHDRPNAPSSAGKLSIKTPRAQHAVATAGLRFPLVLDLVPEMVRDDAIQTVAASALRTRVGALDRLVHRSQPLDLRVAISHRLSQLNQPVRAV